MAARELGRSESARLSRDEENDPTQALQTARDYQPDVVILDFLMPRLHGAEIAWKIAGDGQLRKTPRVILCSGVPTDQFEFKLPPIRIEILEKPVTADALIELLHCPPVDGPAHMER